MASDTINLHGRVFIRGDIRTLTGLHIGGAQTGLAIGGIDNVVIRDPRTNRPYIPGSSLKGKMRSLAEKLTGAPQNQSIGKDVKIHIAKGAEEYRKFWVNPIFGVPADEGWIAAPTRLIVRDVVMSEASAEELDKISQADLYTEVKWEAAIDRVTSAATPRQMERVPAGVIFSPFEMVYSVYKIPDDLDNFYHILECMQLLEDDYLGGQGTRGSGKIRFENVAISIRISDDYGREEVYATAGSVQEVINYRDGLREWLHTKFRG